MEFPPPRLEFLPPLLRLPPLLDDTAATSAEVSLERVATTEVEAEFEDQTLSALSKIASYVVALKSISAIWFLTTDGRDLRQIPRTVSAQQHPVSGFTFGQILWRICLPRAEGVLVMT